MLSVTRRSGVCIAGSGLAESIEAQLEGLEMGPVWLWSSPAATGTLADAPIRSRHVQQTVCTSVRVLKSIVDYDYKVLLYWQ